MDLGYKLKRDPELRKFFWDLIAFCKVYDSTMLDNNSMYYREGRRSVGLKVLKALLKNSEGREAFRQMQEEGVEKHNGSDK